MHIMSICSSHLLCDVGSRHERDRKEQENKENDIKHRTLNGLKIAFNDIDLTLDNWFNYRSR